MSIPMSFKRLLYSFFTAITAAFFLLFGLIALILPWTRHLQDELFSLIENHPWAITLFGASLTFIGIALLLQIIASSRKQYVTIQTGPNSIQFSEAIVADYIQAFWEQLFPEREIPCRISIKRNKICIVADLPHIPKSERKELLKKIEEGLAETMRYSLGCTKTLELTISFAKGPILKPEFLHT